MDFDPQKMTGRTGPAQIPVAPRGAPAGANPPKLATQGRPAPAPEFPSAANWGRVEGTGPPDASMTAPTPLAPPAAPAMPAAVPADTSDKRSGL
jgi:hypothetical protein